MRCLNKYIPQFFGFSFFLILFFDSEKDELYTITFGDEDENAYKL